MHAGEGRIRLDAALAPTGEGDQVEWLDDQRVLYELPRSGSAKTDVWVIPADGSGTPAILVPHACSPSVVR